MHLQVAERELLDPGFRRAYQPPEKPGSPPVVPAGGGSLAKLRKGERVRPRRVRVQKQECPQAAMPEAALIHSMQAHGIGRPSTYASTVETLIARGYVTRHQTGDLTTTDRGRVVYGFLTGRFPGLFGATFTARMETRLDELARNKVTYREAVGEFWRELSALLKKGSHVSRNPN